MFGIGEGKKVVNPQEGGFDMQATLAENMKLIQSIVQEMGQMRNQISGIQETRGQQQPIDMNTNYVNPDTVEPKPKRLAELSEDEMDDLSPQQVYSMMQKEISEDITSSLKEQLEPLTQQLSQVESTSAQDRAGTEINSFMGEKDEMGKLLRPDFNDWRTEMASIHEKSPGLSINQLYTLARSENSEKLGELNKKYSPEVEGGNIIKPSFGGMQPNLMNKTTDGGDLSVEDAARESLNKMKETYGDIPQDTAQAL